MAAIFTTIAAYLYCDYGNVITLWFWTITFIIAISEFLVMVFYVSFCFFIPITLLNYRFDELIDKLRVSIRWNNTNSIHRIIANHNDLISDCKQLNGPYNMLIGLTYCVAPYIIALQLEIIIIDKNDLIFKIIKIVFIIIFIITNVNAFIINQISASITVRNKSIHKYLYPMFYWKRKIRIRTKLTIDSSIARLNTQFIGFFCFNLFEFTKISFYEYAFSVTSCYFLITDIIKH